MKNIIKSALIASSLLLTAPVFADQCAGLNRSLTNFQDHRAAIQDVFTAVIVKLAANPSTFPLVSCILDADPNNNTDCTAGLVLTTVQGNNAMIEQHLADLIAAAGC